MLPNETPATRYCYTCATAAGSLKLQLEANDGFAGASNPDDLEMQPLDDTSSSSSKPRGRIPQIAPSRSGARVAAARSGVKQVRPPTTVPNIAPMNRSSARIAVPVTPVAPGTDAGPVAQSATSGSRNRISSARFDIPQIAPRPEDFQTQDKSGFPAKLAIGLCAMVLVGILGVWATRSGKQPAPADTQVASVTPQAPVLPRPSTNPPAVGTSAKNCSKTRWRNSSGFTIPPLPATASTAAIRRRINRWARFYGRRVIG